MKKTLAVSAVLALVLTGCAKNNPEPTPTVTPSVEVSPTIISEPSTPRPTRTTQQPTEPKEVPTQQPTRSMPEPTAAPSTTSGAKTPAVEFAERWGKRYPDVPEYAILKAAKGVCKVVEQYPDWTNSKIAQAAIEQAVASFGLQENDGVEFAQDAQQNYCSSVSNPT